MPSSPTEQLRAWRESTMVSTRALREWRVARCALGPTELARAVGWFDGRGKPDSQRVRRSLGLAPTTVKGIRYWRERIGYGDAVLLACAMGADPVDFDL